jgi:hypothetical protein
MLRHMVMRLACLFAPVLALLAGCGQVATSGAAASEPGATSSATAEPTDTAGRIEALDCGEDKRSSALSVDYDMTTTGFLTPVEAAHALGDAEGIPRSRLTQRESRGPLGRPVFEYLEEDGRVVAFVSVERRSPDRWIASSLVACRSLYSG